MPKGQWDAEVSDAEKRDREKVNGAEEDAAIKAVVDTLRYFTWIGPTANEVLTSVANDVEQRGADPDCCPVCEEVICDSGCPLEPYRKP